MPITRRRAAMAAVKEEESTAPIDISSDSDAESEELGSDEDEDESSSDEDYVNISDSDSEDEEGNRAGNDEEEEVEQFGVDRSEAACSKVADLLRRGRNLDGIKLVELKAYLKKNGLSQTGDMATCEERIMLHWRFKDGDPEKIYPRSSFCINCKGDVCRGDAVLFKQKVYEKSGKRHSKCIGKRIVAGKVVKESYGKQKQQHTFTIQVFWSKGLGKLPPLHLLLVKGRNLYRMMTFRQPWWNEADRLKALEEKHGRGDAARRVRALNRPNSGGHVLKGKELEKGKHQPLPGRSDGGSRNNKGKKRVKQSSNSDHPTKRSRKEEHVVSSGKNGKRDGQRAKTNCAPLAKNICSSSSSDLGNDNVKTNHVALQKNSDVATLNNRPYNKEVRMTKMKVRLEPKNIVAGNHAQFQGTRGSSASHVQAYHGNLVGINQPFFERPPRPHPFQEVGNSWHSSIDGNSIAYPNPTTAFPHPNAALAGWRAPSYFGEPPPHQLGVAFPSFGIPQTTYHSRPEGANAMPQFRYSGGSIGFPR